MNRSDQNKSEAYSFIITLSLIFQIICMFIGIIFTVTFLIVLSLGFFMLVMLSHVAAKKLRRKNSNGNSSSIKKV